MYRIFKFKQKQYRLYADADNKVFAALISNQDLIDNGFDTNGQNFRIVTLFFKFRNSDL